MNSLNADNRDEAPYSSSVEPEPRRRRVRKRVADAAPSASVSNKKRRRRRSSQTEDKSLSLKQRKRQFYIVFIVFLTLFLLILAGTFSIGYHNSRSFRGKLLADLESGSGADVSFSQLRVSPTLATARKIEYTWTEEQKSLSSVTLKNVSADYFIGGLLGGSWSGSELSAQSGEVYLNLGWQSDASESESFDYKSKYGLDRIKCKALNIYAADGSLLIKESLAHFKWGGAAMLLQLAGGDLTTTDLGGFDVEQGFIRLDSHSTELSLKLVVKDGGGRVSVQGSIREGDSSPLVLDVEKLPSSVLFGESLARLILGDWSGEAGRLNFKNGDDGKTHYEVQVTSANVHLGRLDCFALLAEISQNNSYRRPQFERGGSLQVVREGDLITLRDLFFRESRGIVLGGTLSAKQNTIEGELRVGVPLHEKANLERHFEHGTFSISEGGYLWETIQLSGKLGALKDDLRTRLRSEGIPQVELETPSSDIQPNKAPRTQEQLEADFQQLISK